MVHRSLAGDSGLSDGSGCVCRTSRGFGLSWEHGVGVSELWEPLPWDVPALRFTSVHPYLFFLSFPQLSEAEHEFASEARWFPFSFQPGT